jgi:hypothetical protein
MLRNITLLEDLPDRPNTRDGGYMPTVDLWRDVRWTLTPGQRDIFPSGSYQNWPENFRPVPIAARELLDLAGDRPAVLLMGCSYLAGDYLSNPDRLIYRLRERVPGVSFSCIAASGGGLITNLAHAAQLLPASYQPDFVVLSPTQSFRQYIPESTVQFNESPYALWQHYYWFRSQRPARRDAIVEELCRRDCLRLDHMLRHTFPRARFLLVLFDSSGTGEMTLLQPAERALLEKWAARHAQRVRILLDRDEMMRLYLELGPFEKKHPNPRQIEALAARVARELASHDLNATGRIDAAR